MRLYSKDKVIYKHRKCSHSTSSWTIFPKLFFYCYGYLLIYMTAWLLLTKNNFKVRSPVFKDEWETCDFTPLFNSISFIAGGWAVDNERLCPMESVYSWDDFDTNGDRTRTAGSVDRRLTTWAIRGCLPVFKVIRNWSYHDNGKSMSVWTEQI